MKPNHIFAFLIACFLLFLAKTTLALDQQSLSKSRQEKSDSLATDNSLPSADDQPRTLELNWEEISSSPRKLINGNVVLEFKNGDTIVMAERHFYEMIAALIEPSQTDADQGQ